MDTVITHEVDLLKVPVRLYAESTLAFMGKLHRLICQLDELVLSHPHVYKVESVGNCYMVASGIPKVSTIFESMHE